MDRCGATTTSSHVSSHKETTSQLSEITVSNNSENRAQSASARQAPRAQPLLLSHLQVAPAPAAPETAPASETPADSVAVSVHRPVTAAGAGASVTAGAAASAAAGTLTRTVDGLPVSRSLLGSSYWLSPLSSKWKRRLAEEQETSDPQSPVIAHFSSAAAALDAAHVAGPAGLVAGPGASAYHSGRSDGDDHDDPGAAPPPVILLSEFLARTNTSSLLVDDVLCIHICPCVRRAQRRTIAGIRNHNHPPTFDFSPPALAAFFQDPDAVTCGPQLALNLSDIQAAVANVTAVYLARNLGYKTAPMDAVHTVVLGDLYGLSVIDVERNWRIPMAAPQVGVPTECNNLFRAAPVVAQFIRGLQEVAMQGRQYMSVHLRRGDFAVYSKSKGFKNVYLSVADFVSIMADRIQRAGRNETTLFLATDGSADEVQQFKLQLLEKSNITTLTLREFMHTSHKNLHSLPWFAAFRAHQIQNNVVVPTSIVVDKFMCVGSSVFFGSQRSSFTLDIMHMREQEGVRTPLDAQLQLVQ